MKTCLMILPVLAVGLHAQIGKTPPSTAYPAAVSASDIALTPSAAYPTVHASRTVEAPGHFYIVDYEYSTRVGFTTALGCDNCNKMHYSAAIRVFEVLGGARIQIGHDQPGQYTVEGCFEDDPLALVESALSSALRLPGDQGSELKEFREWRAAEVSRRAFEAMPLYELANGVLRVTDRGKRDLKAVTVGDAVLWGAIPEQPQTSLTGTSMTGVLAVSHGSLEVLTHSLDACVKVDADGHILNAPCSLGTISLKENQK